MYENYSFMDDFCGVCEDLVGDVVLLESLILYRKQGKCRLSQEQFSLLVHRVTDYLRQHTGDLLVLTRTDK